MLRKYLVNYSKVSIPWRTVRQFANSFPREVKTPLYKTPRKTSVLPRLGNFKPAHRRALAARLAWEYRFVSTNGLRRKTQLSRNQSLIFHLVSVRCARRDYRSFLIHLRSGRVPFFLLLFCFRCVLHRAAPLHSCFGRFCPRTKLQFALSRLRGASPVRYCIATRIHDRIFVWTSRMNRLAISILWTVCRDCYWK